MSAQTNNVPRVSAPEEGPLVSYFPAVGVAAGAHIYAGACVGVSATGYIAPMGSAYGLRALGVSEEEVDNSTGAAGDVTAKKIRRGAWRFVNSTSTEAVSDADVGRIGYAADDQTVARTSGGGTRNAMGRIVGVSSLGVLIEVGVSDDKDAGADILLLANADLSAKQYHFVDIVNSAGVPKFASVSTAGARISGVLQNAPAAGAVAIVRPVASGRQTRLIAGGVVTCGESLASTNAGRAKTAVAGTVSGASVVSSFVGGIALSTTAADGDVMYALLSASGATPTTAA